MTVRFVHFLLLVVLLAGQFGLSRHQVDLDAHQPGDTCEVCVQASPLGHGAVPAAPVLALPVHRLPAPPARCTLLHRQTDCGFAARAPPVTFA